MNLDHVFVEQYAANHEIPWGYSGLGEIVYMRTYSRRIEEQDRNETWPETIERAINGAQAIGAGYTQEEMQALFMHMYNLRGVFGGRSLWQLGTPLVEKFGGASLINCYYTNIEKTDDFEFLMDHLMVGGGVGFSVERALVHEFPKIKTGVTITHERVNDADFIVPDSREGWTSLLHKVLESFFVNGKSFTYSTILIRSFGAPLKTFGGTASGPDILIEGIQAICGVLSARAGKKMRSLDALDIANIIGMVVVAGSARRSAQLAGGDPDDFLFIRAKNWQTGQIPSWRSNSNNSLFANSYSEVVDEVWKGYNGSGEPYGLLNRKLAGTQGRLGEYIDDRKIEGFNPCAEIALEDGEVCNLAEIFLPNIESAEQLDEIARLLYKAQKAITSLSFPYEKTRKVVERNRRLGLGITGWLQATPDQLSWISPCYEMLRNFDTKWSQELGINESIKLTAVKPSGTLSLLAGVTPGIHSAYSRYYIRRVRIMANDPIVDYCRQRGYSVEYDIGIDGARNHRTVVVSFPCESPEEAVLAETLTAVEQLEWMVRAQTEWADNAVSATVYYHQDELPEIQEWLREN
jgi:ribonucleoside-triphosphate reductase (thioredoxin)